MRHSLGLLFAAILVLAPAAAAASNVSADDLVKLHAAGLNDDVLIALIESDGAVFKLSAEDILALRERGLSQKVILAMLQTAKKPAAEAPALPQPAAGDHPPDVPARVETVEPPAPVVVTVTQQVEQRVEAPRPSEPRYVTQPLYVTYPIFVAPPVKPAPPVYWGFGGQRRPDTWRRR